MASFTLPTGRIVAKNATYCVAVRCSGRWSHRYFKTEKGARNELSFLRNCSNDTKAYYNIESFQLIKGA